ncbi:hypothetical protein PZH42_29975, partial [Bacteroides cellulosilyticus]|nr:hypothetical protein [Bacteroides cellulosilyticus]
MDLVRETDWHAIRKLGTMHVHIHSILYALQIRVFQCSGGAMLFVHLPDELYKRMLQLLHDIKAEIDQYR